MSHDLSPQTRLAVILGGNRNPLEAQQDISVEKSEGMSKRLYGDGVRRLVRAAAAGAAVTTMAFAGAAGAGAQPPPDPCSPAAVMRAHASAMTEMADYLDSHPDVQQAFQDARSEGTPQERQTAMKAYTDSHPDVAAAFQSIRQPVKDLNVSCGLPQGMMPGGMAAQDGLMPGGMMPG